MKKPIVFFDGVCGLCNRFVDFIVRVDRSERVLLSPLQSKAAIELLPEELRKPDELFTVVFYDNGTISTRSTAVLKTMLSIGGIWKIAAILYVIPRPLRDVLYGLVSRNRYRWFGKKASCRLPTPEEKERFL